MFSSTGRERRGNQKITFATYGDPVEISLFVESPNALPGVTVTSVTEVTGTSLP